MLTPDGTLLYAAGQAKRREARSALRRAVLAMELARGPLRRKDAGSALSLWRELTAGRWTLVEHIESRGRRLLFAHVNPPDTSTLRELSPRQSSIVRLLLNGHSSSWVASELGISAAAVSQQLANVLRKLRLRSTTELLLSARVAKARPLRRLGYRRHLGPSRRPGAAASA